MAAAPSRSLHMAERAGQMGPCHSFVKGWEVVGQTDRQHLGRLGGNKDGTTDDERAGAGYTLIVSCPCVEFRVSNKQPRRDAWHAKRRAPVSPDTADDGDGMSGKRGCVVCVCLPCGLVSFGADETVCTASFL